MGSSLDERQRAKIKELLAHGLPSAYIASQLGLRPMQVAGVKARVTMAGAVDAGASTDATRAPRLDQAPVAAKVAKRGAAAVGIDVAEPRRGLDVVALDSQRSVLLSQGRLSIAEAVDLTLKLAPAVACIDSPSGWARTGRSRLAERVLAKVGIQSYRTPSDPRDNPFYGWMRVGFEVFSRLADHYEPYRTGDVTGTAAEIFPHATACLLAGELRPPAVSKEYFRRRVLADFGVPEHELRTLDSVDAALGALTGLIALSGGHCSAGDPSEGVILLPVTGLPENAFRVEPGARTAPRPERGSTRTKQRRGSLDYEKAAAFIASLAPGEWTSYGDVAAAAGNRKGAQAIGTWALRHGHELHGIHRVMRSDGYVAEAFRAAGPGVPRDAPAARELLRAEGVHFDERGRASQQQRMMPRA